MRTMTAVAYDIRFQIKHGFYGVYALVCAIYVLLLRFLPQSYKEKVALLLTFSDPGALGLILAGGIVLLEKDQGVHDSLFVTPLRLREYLLAKAFSISVISLFAAWAIHMFSTGMPAAPFRFSIGVLLTSSMFTFLSIGVVARTQSINGFILLSQMYSLPLALPLLGFFGIGPDVLYRIFPTEGSLVLLEAAYRSVTVAETLYATALLIVGNASFYLWAHRSFERKILLRIGEGGAKG
ncbi:ABC transporter permease [Paenibacillus mesophilus]|uniref:fluoroquinolone export ABC transporter permease subunit n=1 Tax=Paenibacillus mesophilus TaxID=2582849 RepID=UPI00110F64BF|nr:ABC transporter permease [Paenibacillus mesophilus]TMV46817.1 ABC transporter permease [Paenibacillus mesophilus]